MESEVNAIKQHNKQQDLLFRPFYIAMADWLSARIGVPICGILILSFIPGALFLLAHYFATTDIQSVTKIIHFHSWTWLIGFMIMAATLALYYATYTLKELLFLHIGYEHSDSKKNLYINPLKQTLSNRHFIIVGIFFGLTNAYMGYLFKIPYVGFAPQLSIICGFFIVGFICGMAVWGIYGVLVIINILVKEDLFKIDYTAPDGCGGTQFLGSAFIKFSSVTLIIGVLISIYILCTWWANEPSFEIKLAIGLWVAFPYFTGILVLAIPSVLINRMLVEYKLHKEKDFSAHLAKHRNLLAQKNLDSDSRDSIEASVERLEKDRLTLHKMFTWPFGKANGFNYSLVFLANLFISFESLFAIAPDTKASIIKFISSLGLV